MLEDQFESLAQYLPKDVYMGQSLDYARYHARAISVNGSNGLYTLEYFAFHILWMSFLEKITFQLYRCDAEGVKLALGNDGNVNKILGGAQILYDLSEINEKKLCEIAKYPMIGYHSNQVGNLRDLVDKRDHIAHCSGVLDLDQEDVLLYARKCVKYAQDIHSKVENITLASWDDFIKSLSDDGGQYTLVHDAVVEYLAAEYISVADILTILEKRPLQDSRSSESTFRANLALMQIALIAEDYDTSQELAEMLKLSILSHKISEDQQSQVQDENEAYVQFRVGLAR